MIWQLHTKNTNLYMINLAIQIFFIFLFIILLALYFFVAYAARRAAHQTTIPIPKVWQRIMLTTLLIIITGLVFTIFIHP